MSKVSVLTHTTRATRAWLFAMFAIACVVLASGCGGGSSSASTPPPGGGLNPPGPQTPATIDGVATPTSVAVVTATNTQ